MKKIVVIGTVGHIGMGRTVLTAIESDKIRNMTVKEQEQVKQIDKTHKRFSNLESFDDSKCRKGHSYRKKIQENGQMLSKPKWVCTKCEREL